MSYPLKKLSEIVKVGPQKSEVKDFIGEVSFVPMKDLKAKEKFFEVNEIKNISEVYKGYTYFKDNDILLAKVTPCFENGKSGIAKNLINGIGFGSSEFFVLRCSKDILEDYLYYKISSDNFLFEGKGNMSGAVGLQRVTKSFLENTEIPLPPLPAQETIVQKLDEAFARIDASIELAEKSLKAIEEGKASVLEEVFGSGEYEEKNLGDIFDVRDGTHDSPKFHSEGFPLVTSKNLVNNSIDLTNVKLINEEDYIAINKRSKVDKGDLLFAMIGTIGNPTIVDFEPNFAIKNVALFKKKNENASMQYLKYFLQSDFNVKKMLNEANGATQKFVGLGYLRKFKLPLPPLSKQKEIVEYLDRVFEGNKKLKESYEQKIASLREMKQSLLREAFEGRLVRE